MVPSGKDRGETAVFAGYKALRPSLTDLEDLKLMT